jgi:hypothetical protein
VLNRLIGRDPVEVGKTIVLLFSALIAAVALQQLAATRSSQTAGQVDRAAVVELAADFGKELTTYDYAHPDVQANRLAPLTTRQVQQKVKQAFPDLALYQAVSVGDPPDAYVQTLDADRAEVLLQTRSTMQSQYVPAGTRTSGLLLCDVQRGPSGWRVSDYRWLTPVTEGVSYATPSQAAQ